VALLYLDEENPSRGGYGRRKHGLVLEDLGHLAAGYLPREPLNDGGFADLGLADGGGVVLGVPGEDLEHALYLVLAPHHGVDLPSR
jgi:hypothetical protein